MSLLKRRRLRVDITTIFICVLFATTLTIIFFTYERNMRAGLRLTEKLIQHSHQTIIEQLHIFLRPKVFVNLSTTLLDDQVITIDEVKKFSMLVHAAMDSYPQMESVYFADPVGDFYLHHRVLPLPANTARYQIPIVGDREIPANTRAINIYIKSHRYKTQAKLTYQDQQGAIIKSETVSNVVYDPRKRPWYHGALSAKNSSWLGLYQFYPANRLGVSFASPIYIHKQFSGVISVDLDSNEISKQLSDINVSTHSETFIVNQRGDLIAKKNSLNGEIDNPLIKKAIYLYEKNQKNVFIFSHDYVSYIAVFSLYAFNQQGDWHIATVAPLDEFVGEFKITNYYTLFFSLVMLVIGAGLVLIFAHKISQPVIRLSRQMRRLKQLDFSNMQRIHSPIYEIQVMSDALHSAIVALSSFAKYIPKILVTQLMQNKLIAESGGEKKLVTILFTDIANFTEIAETMDPDLLMLHVSEYLNLISEIIHHYQGNIDKYIGDAVMAFWNDPILDPEHVLHACLAVLGCKHKLLQMNAKWEKHGRPPLVTRFGLHTGLAIVGNVGSEDRLNYTLLGDSVNLASRLEALNKNYGTSIIVSDAVYEACKDQLLFRPIDVVKVRGKRQETVIYELMAALPQLHCEFSASANMMQLAEWTTLGYSAFHAGDVIKAREIFEKILQEYPQDCVAKLYVARIH